MPWRRLLVLLVLAAIAAPAAAHAEPTATIKSYGIYDTRRSGAIEKGERTATGELRSVDLHVLKQQTDEIMGQLGNSFGVELDLGGFPEGAVTLTIRTIHPPLTNPKTGTAMTVSEYDWVVTGRDGVYFGYSFDYGWEIAEGTWTKQFLYNGKIIAEKSFKVIVPLN